MIHDTKIAIVVREDLAAWQKLNVACFLSGGLAGAYPEIVGEPYADADGRAYTPLIRQPVLVFGAGADRLKRTWARAIGRGVRIAVYTEALFATDNDGDNRAAVAGLSGADLDLVGLGLHAERKVADKFVNGLKLLS